VLTEQDRAAVAQHGEVAELMPRVGLGDWSGASRQLPAGEEVRRRVRRQRAEVEA
jgi:hypothetical protein